MEIKPCRQNMEESAKTKSEEKRSGGFGWYGLWAGVIVLLYILSIGPYAMWEEHMASKGLSVGSFNVLYIPWWWIYEKTPFHRPLGLYMHLWVPLQFDKQGKPIYSLHIVG
jgi:hypothetical protein